MNKKTQALQDFLTDDQILEVLLLFDKTRKIQACKLLQKYMAPKWEITVLQAMDILQAVQKEWEPPEKVAERGA